MRSGLRPLAPIVTLRPIPTGLLRRRRYWVAVAQAEDATASAIMNDPRPIWPRLAATLFLGLPLGCSSMNSQSLNSEGGQLYQSGNYQQAADKFQKAIASNPRDATSYYNLAASLHKTGKLANRPGDL